MCFGAIYIIFLALYSLLENGDNPSIYLLDLRSGRELNEVLHMKQLTQFLKYNTTSIYLSIADLHKSAWSPDAGRTEDTKQ